MKYLVANWKAHKSVEETGQWWNIFSQKYQAKENLQIIIAPSFSHLSLVKNLMRGVKNISLAAQDLSQFNEGDYTGEVTAKALQGLVEYVILGHSERRQYFAETNQTIAKKVELAHIYELKTILCLRGNEDVLISGVEMVAYEPVGAIGTGNNQPLNKVLEFKQTLSLGDSKFLYGGSVNDANLSDYLQTEQIDGLLVGGASLNPEQFLRIIAAV